MLTETHFLPTYRLESDLVELEDIMSQRRTFWGKVKRVMGKPWTKDVKKRLNQFEDKASDLDMRVEVRSTVFIQDNFLSDKLIPLRELLLGLTFGGHMQAYILRRLVRIFQLLPVSPHVFTVMPNSFFGRVVRNSQPRWRICKCVYYQCPTSLRDAHVC